MIRHVDLPNKKETTRHHTGVKLSPDQSSSRPDSRNPLSSFILSRRFFHERKIHACVKDKQLGLLRIGLVGESVTRYITSHFRPKNIMSNALHASR